MASQFASILLNILGPLIVMMALGALLYRKFKIDIGTMSKLTIYLLGPAFVFHNVSTSQLAWRDMSGIVGMTLIQVATLAVFVVGIGKSLGASTKTLATVALSVLLYNSANYGLALADLAYGADAAAVQTFVFTTQSLLTWTLGMVIASWAGTGSFWRGMLNVLRTPILPTLAAALLARWLTDSHPDRIPLLLSKSAAYLSGGLVPLALITLGAQLASNPKWPRWRPVSLVLVLRLLFAPAWMAAMLYAFHRFHVRALDLWPRPAQTLILTAGTPTAINTLLLTLELGGDTELSADCVFWTTILSLVSITLWIAILAPLGR